jgi:hypothetical protein
MRFAIEHLPRTLATYQVSPLEFNDARAWLGADDVISLVRTTEMIGAIRAGFGLSLEQSDTSMALRPGDQALLITLSFSVLLAWAQGNLAPRSDDWRCLLLDVQTPSNAISTMSAAEASGLTSDPG